MATKIASLFVELKANTAKYSAGMDKARSKSKKTMEGITRNLKKIAVPLAAIGTAAATAFGVMVKSAINTGDQLAKMSERTGVAVETLSGLGFAAEQSGTDLEFLSERMVNLARRAKEGDRGVLSYKQAFDKLDISLRNNQGKLKATDTLLLEIADKFSQMEDGTLKAALATDLFSNQGTKLIPFLNQGSAGILKLTKQAKQLGIVWTQESAKAAENFNDKLNIMKRRMTGVATSVGTAILPALNLFASALLADSNAIDVFSEKAKRARLDAEKFSLQPINIPVKFLKKTLLDEDDNVPRINQINREIAASIQRETDARIRFNEINEAMAALVRAQTIPALNELAKTTKAAKDPIKEITDALQLQLNTYGLSADQLAIYNLALLTNDEAILTNAENILAQKRALEEEDEATAKATEKLKRFNDELQTRGARIFQETRTALELYNAELAKLDFLLDVLVIDQDLYDRSLAQLEERFDAATKGSKKLRQELTDMEQLGLAAGNAIGRGFENAIFSGKGLRNVLAGILEDIGRILFRAAFSSVLKGIFGFFTGGVGLAFEHGGSPPVGKPSLVGEGGPELFVPNTAGKIIPNDELRGSGGTTNIIDARGATPGMEHRIMRALAMTENRAAMRAIAAMQDSRLRSG